MDLEPVLSRAEFAAYGGVVTGVSQHLVGAAFVDCLNVWTGRLGELGTRWPLAKVTFTDGSTADAYDILSLHGVVARDDNWIIALDSNGTIKAGRGMSF